MIRSPAVRRAMAVGWLMVGMMLVSPAQAQITFRGATQAFAAGGGVATNITHVGAGASDTRNNCGDILPTIPAGSVGDVLVALVNSRESNAVVTMPGWNQLYAQQHPGRDFVARIYWRRATSAVANGDARTITQAVSCNSIAGQISRFAGVDSLQAFESNPIPAGNAVIQNSSAIDTGSQITSVNNSMLLVASFMGGQCSD